MKGQKAGGNWVNISQTKRAEGSKPTPTERVFGIDGGLSTSYPVVYYVIRYCPWGKIAHTVFVFTI